MSAVAVPQQQFAQQQQGREVIAEQHLGAEGCWYVASNWSNDWFINAVQVVIPLAGCHGYQESIQSRICSRELQQLKFS
jgi:hypothetical protein